VLTLDQGDLAVKRFHVHAPVTDLQASITFYSELFGADPTRVESEYAKWMLEDPRINFAISMRGGWHHSRLPAEADTNFGRALVISDQVFGTSAFGRMFSNSFAGIAPSSVPAFVIAASAAPQVRLLLSLRLRN
jgi:catechol 2,3-dioxygenase-like lactoylglutathione lyase family enzyme